MSQPPRFELVSPPAPAPNAVEAAAAWDALAEPPRLRRSAARLVDGVVRTQKDQDLVQQWPQRLVAWAATAEAALRALPPGTDPAVAARAVVAALCEYSSGMSVRMPGPESVRRLIRDAAIWDAFDGRNAAELSRRFRLPRSTIYLILQKQRALRQSARRRRLGAI